MSPCSFVKLFNGRISKIALQGEQLLTERFGHGASRVACLLGTLPKTTGSQEGPQEKKVLKVCKCLWKDVGGFKEIIIKKKKKSSLKEKKHFKMDFCCSFSHEIFYFWRHIESNVVSILWPAITCLCFQITEKVSIGCTWWIIPWLSLGTLSCRFYWAILTRGKSDLALFIFSLDQATFKISQLFWFARKQLEGSWDDWSTVLFSTSSLVQWLLVLDASFFCAN